MLDEGLLKLMILNNALSYVKTLNKLKKILQKHFIINDKNQLSSLL